MGDAPTSRHQHRVIGKPRRAEPRHGVSEMVDVDDLGQVVGPFGTPHPGFRQCLCRHFRAGGELRGHRREQVAAVKARRKPGRGPGDAPRAARRTPPQHDLEQPVIGADIAPPVRLHHERPAVPADAGIDHAQEDGRAREHPGQRRQQVSGGPGPESRCIAEQVDHGNPRRLPRQHGLHLTGIGARRPEIGE